MTQETKAKRRTITDAERDVVRRLYADTPTAVIAGRLGRSVQRIYRIAKGLGIKKSPEYMAACLAECARGAVEAGKPHRFTKGHIPANKGLRRPGWHRGRMKETQFKKGQRSINWKPIGSERICSKSGYLLVKVTEGRPINYKAKHRIVWEEHNGPIPKDGNIIFKDGNKLNTDISNLELVTDAELMLRNTFHNYPEPVKQQIHVLAGFKRKLNSYAKKQNRGPA